MATDINDRVDKLEAIAQDTAVHLAELKFALVELKGELKAEIKVAVAEAKTSTITWVVSAIFLAQLLPALLKGLGVFPH